MSGTDLSQFSMRDVFRIEVEGQAQALTAGLLALEQNPRRADQLEACMRAAHSLKGAARIVEIGAGVTLAHAMEELFVAAQEGRTILSQAQIDQLFVPLLNDQAIDRVQRLGVDGSKPVTVIAFKTQDSIESRIEQINRDTRRIFGIVVGGLSEEAYPRH